MAGTVFGELRGGVGERAPNSWTWETLFVVVYYESMNITVIDQVISET